VGTVIDRSCGHAAQERPPLAFPRWSVGTRLKSTFNAQETKAKPYQVKQIREVIPKYHLTGE